MRNKILIDFVGQDFECIADLLTLTLTLTLTLIVSSDFSASALVWALSLVNADLRNESFSRQSFCD